MLHLYPDNIRKSNDGTKNEETIHPGAVEAICENIEKACKGIGTDEDKLTSALGSLKASEREAVSIKFQEMYGKSLLDRIKGETSGDYGYLAQMMSMPIEEAEAVMVRNALHGKHGGKTKHLIPIICARSNEDMDMLRNTYAKLYGKDMFKELRSRVSGEIERLLVYSSRVEMENYNPNFHTLERAEVEAKELYKAGQGKWGTDKDAFYKFLSRTPPEFLRDVDKAYTRKYGNTIEKAIKKEFRGKIEDATLFPLIMALNPCEAIAMEFENSMHSLGTDEVALSNLVVRYQSLLPGIEEAYQYMYEKSLSSRIRGDTGGDYKNLLMTVLGAK